MQRIVLQHLFVRKGKGRARTADQQKAIAENCRRLRKLRTPPPPRSPTAPPPPPPPPHRGYTGQFWAAICGGQSGPKTTGMRRNGRGRRRQGDGLGRDGVEAASAQ